MPTAHNTANPGEFAKTVLMPGDPLRAKFIAETFLTDAKLVNNVRGIQGYTGTYKGVPVSVMASGMGMPSMGIYSYELFQFYDVDNIIRIGSAGAMTADLKLRSIVAAQAACTDSNFAHQYQLPGAFAPIASYELLETAVAIAREMGVTMPVGNVLSSDVFYDASGENAKWCKMGVLCAEMEAAALAKIKDILAKLAKGEKFEELAKQHSDCPSGKEGGKLGDYNPDQKMPQGQMVPEFTEAFNGLKPGETTTAPVKTQFGYHIIKASDVIIRTLEEVAPQIREMLKNEQLQQKIPAIIEQIKKDFSVKLYTDATK